MESKDFVRQMPGYVGSFSSGRTLWQRVHVDMPLLLLLLMLTVYGLVVLYSGSGQQMATVHRQGTFFGLAYGVMFFVAQFRLQFLRRWAPWLFVLGVVLLLAVPYFGTGAKGAKRWLSIAGLPRFQPSEIMKLVVPMAVAWYLSERVMPPRIQYVLISLLLILLPTVLIAMQPDLGTAILIAASGLFVLLLAGLPWRYMMAAFALLVGSAWPLWEYGLRDYQRQRILTLLDPEGDKLGSGWNIIQSVTAIGSGGFEGKGWLLGTQSQLDFLPESHTDFIIAVLAEEFGLMGVMLLLAIYFCIICRGLYIAYLAQGAFNRLLAGSITLTFFVYIFVNMGMVSGLLPIVGVPLPLVSQGGTSIITLMAGFGILMAISTEKRRIGH